MNCPRRLMFLDSDGCLTSVRDGNYFNPDPEKYHVSESIVGKVNSFCENYGVKVVISSNWRKFDIDGIWKSSLGSFKNPIREITEKLGHNYFSTLPPTRHVKKSEALVSWLNANRFDGDFVIFDDDLRENYQLTSDHGISERFILVDSEYGITDKDLDSAKKILHVH